MAKKAVNPYLAKWQLKTELMLRIQRLFSIQQSCDMAMIALSDEFGFGPERLKRFNDAYTRVFLAYIDMADEDGRADPDIEYTRAKVDGKLKQICGQYFEPWEVRFKGCDY